MRLLRFVNKQFDAHDRVVSLVFFSFQEREESVVEKVKAGQFLLARRDFHSKESALRPFFS